MAENAVSDGFTPAFEHLCGFVAVTHVQKDDETLQQLLLQTMVLFSAQAFQSVQSFQSPLDDLFGLKLPASRIEAAIDQLLREGLLHKPDGRTFVIKPEVRSGIQDRIDDAVRLQDVVKTKWISEVAESHPNLDPSVCWKGLQEYLTGTFREHGIQTMALLHVSTGNRADQTESLRAVLRRVVDSLFPSDLRAEASVAIEGFLSTVGQTLIGADMWPN